MNQTVNSKVDKNISQRNKVISIEIKDKQALYMAYMPFLKEGGLFLPTKKDYNLGDEVFLLVKILDEIEPTSISGEVAWITPSDALGNRPAGVGVSFIGENARKTANLIESKLGGSLSLGRSTHTM